MTLNFVPYCGGLIMNKFVKMAAVSLALLGSSYAVAASSTTPVNASSIYPYSSSHWNKNRKVRVNIIKVTFRRYDALKDRFVRGTKKYYYSDVIRVRKAGEFEGWVLAGTKPGSRYWWVNTRANTKWFRDYYKLHKTGWNGNTLTDERGNKLTVDSIQVVDFEESGLPNTDVLINGSFKSNRIYTPLKPTSWIDKNVFVYPSDKTSKDTLFTQDDQIELSAFEGTDAHAVMNSDKEFTSDDGTVSVSIPLSATKASDVSSSYTIEDFDGHKKTFPATRLTLSQYKQNFDFEDDDDE